MITCKQIAEILMDYCAGELPEEFCATVRQHLLLCGHCHNFVASYEITIRVCRALPMAELPPHVLDKVRAALKEGA